MGRAMIENTPTSASAALETFHTTQRMPVKHTSVGILLKRQDDALTLWRAQGDTLTPQAMHVLQAVALQPGITMADLEKTTKLSSASVSRNLMSLGEQHRIGGKAGLGFVEAIEDPVERRRKIAFLTPEGKDFVEKYLGTLMGEEIILDTPTATEFKRRHLRPRL